jgi:hypothetical protein
MSNNNKPKPALDLIKELQLNKIKVMWKNDGPDLLLWCNYGEHTKQKTGQGFEVWGRGQLFKERIQAAVFRYYPKAEITSEAANAHVVFRLNNN